MLMTKGFKPKTATSTVAGSRRTLSVRSRVRPERLVGKADAMTMT